MTTKNKMSFDIDLDGLETEQSLREQVEDQLEENGYTEEEISDEAFEETMDSVYGEEEDDEDEGDELDEDDQDEPTQKKTKSASATDEDTAVKVKQEEAQKEFGDRANKRIRELNAQKKQAFEEAEQARKEKFESDKKMLETRKDLFTYKVDKLKRDFEAAINDGDAAKQVEINSELSKLGADISRVESEIENYKEYKTQVKDKPATEEDVFGVGYDQQTAQKLAGEWEFDNPRVLADKAYADTSLTIAKQLMNRGFKPDTQEFYDELTTRMDMAFGTTTQRATKQTEGQQKSEGANKVVVKKQATPQRVQTVAGASRTAAPTTRAGQPSGKNTVRLGREDIEFAKSNGLDIKTYAFNRDRVEKNMNEKGQIRVDLFPDD